MFFNQLFTKQVTFFIIILPTNHEWQDYNSELAILIASLISAVIWIVLAYLSVICRTQILKKNSNFSQHFCIAFVGQVGEKVPHLVYSGLIHCDAGVRHSQNCPFRNSVEEP
jgi:hypothetical protein